jgi:hypothetical protein
VILKNFSITNPERLSVGSCTSESPKIGSENNAEHMGDRAECWPTSYSRSVLRPLPGIRGATARPNGKWLEILGVPVALPRAVISDDYSMRALHLVVVR